MNHLGLFEGIGGFSLAALWMGWKTIAWCEWNPFCQKVLSYHFPEAHALHDITKTDFTTYHGTVDIITGGFPCQPYSLAGKQKGTEDERHLWPHMLRAIRQVAPRWVIGENVPGLVSWNDGLVFDQVQLDLEALGYEVIPFNIPAAGVGAPHKRERVWFVAFRGDVRTSDAANAQNDRYESGQNIDSGNAEQLHPCKCSRNEKNGCQSERCSGPTENTNQDGWGSEQRQEEPEERGQWNLSAGDNEQLRTNHAETRAVADSTNTGLESVQCGGKDGVHGLETTADTESQQSERTEFEQQSETGTQEQGQLGGSDSTIHATHTFCQRWFQRNEGAESTQPACHIPDWGHFPTQSPVCNGDDGLSAQLDAITFPKWRAESIKAGGNAIVPQVALLIFKAIELFEEQLKQETAA